jgi:hypothetical protein
MDMAQTPKKTVRKLVTLPLDIAERVEQFRAKSSAVSESDALKALIEGGLSRYDKPSDLLLRCQTATERGQTIGDIINSITADHPLVKSTTLESSTLFIYLKEEDPNDPEADRFRFSREEKKWTWERCSGPGEDWEEVRPRRPPVAAASFGGGRPAARAGKAELDDDIPF